MLKSHQKGDCRFTHAAAGRVDQLGVDRMHLDRIGELFEGFFFGLLRIQTESADDFAHVFARHNLLRDDLNTMLCEVRDRGVFSYAALLFDQNARRRAELSTGDHSVGARQKQNHQKRHQKMQFLAQKQRHQVVQIQRMRGINFVLHGSPYQFACAVGTSSASAASAGNSKWKT